MAANPRAIMRALKATAPPASSGGYGNRPAPYIGPGPSPLVQSYNEMGGGHQYGTNSALPRDWRTFLSGMFGPLAPIQPVPIDIPPPGEERPEPRRLQGRVGWNMPMGMPGTEGWGKLANFETLRSLADLYSVARACIELRKNELRGIGWDVAPTAQAAKAMRGDHKAARDFQERRAKIVKFFRKPDPNYTDFTTWFSVILEEFFVTDATALYIHPSRVPGKGLMGTNVAALDCLDGTLIKPLIDIRGGSPAAPNPSYQQFEYGVPRVDLMTLIEDDPELGDFGDLTAEYHGDQLMYLPFSPRVWTPYGQSFIERCLVPVMGGLNKQQYQLEYYASGTVPAVYVSPGDTAMTPSQLRELQDALNAIAGDVAWKHKIIVLPGGAKVDPQKGNTLADEFDTLVQIQTCQGFDVLPFEIGVLPQLSAAASASSGAARQAVTAHVELRQRKSTIPILLFLKMAIFDRIIQDVCGQADMEFQWEGLQEEGTEDEVSQIVEEIGAGLLSIDEGRQMLGLEPWGLPITSDPGWATQWGGFVPLTGVSQATATPLGGAPGPGGAGAKPGQAAPAAPQRTTLDLSTPSTASRPGGPAVPATTPRNRMSGAQRRGQAQQVSSAQNRTGSVGTPAHSGARAVSPSRDGGSQRAGARAAKVIQGMLVADDEDTVKALAAGAADLTHPVGYELDAVKAARELGLLRSYLHRGEPVSAWQPRFIPPRLLGQVAENMAKGMTAGEACDVAKVTLTAAAKSSAERHVTCGQGHQHWGAYGAAGLLISGKGNDGKRRYLLQRRGDTADHAGTWALPGGALHEGELPAAGAIREATEELGVMPTLRPGHVIEDDHGNGWSFYTITSEAPQVFDPPLDGSTGEETAGWGWFTAREARDLPLHPGFAATFDQVRRARSSRTLKDAADPHDPNPVDPEHVANVLRDRYPEDALGWISKIRWIGPIEIPQDRIDYSDEDSWAAYRQPKRVKHFSRLLEAGDELPPAVAVQKPGDAKITVVDGRHRALAEQKRKRPLRCYVGFPDKDKGPWDRMSDAQQNLHDTAVKSAGGYDLSPRSGMISLDLPDGVITPLPSGVSDHHVTVVYLGSDVDDEAFDGACRRARDAAAQVRGPLIGMFSGIDSFPPSAGSDGKTPVFVPASIPGAGELRESLADLSASEHTDWRPHCTLAYLDEGDPMPGLQPPVTVAFGHLTVHRGDDVRRFPFGAIVKSAETAHLAATPDLLGTEGLWHTPDRHVDAKQKLPNYVEHISSALMRDQGLPESEAIAYAINAIKRWAKGDLHWGKGKVSPEVQAASQQALAEWDRLKASHQ